MFQGEPALDWPLAASVQTLRQVMGAVRTERRSMVKVAGRTHPLDLVEITGLILSIMPFSLRRVQNSDQPGTWSLRSVLTASFLTFALVPAVVVGWNMLPNALRNLKPRVKKPWLPRAPRLRF